MFSKDLLKIISGYEREEKLNYRYLVHGNAWEYTIHNSHESAIKYIKEKHPNNIFKEETPEYKKIKGCEITYISFLSGTEDSYMIMKLKSM